MKAILEIKCGFKFEMESGTCKLQIPILDRIYEITNDRELEEAHSRYSTHSQELKSQQLINVVTQINNTFGTSQDKEDVEAMCQKLWELTLFERFL